MAPDTEKKEDAGRKSLIEAVFPTQATKVFYVAIVLGSAMFLLSFLFHFLLPDFRIQSNLILCVGLALVFAAFGSQATVRIGGIVIAGAAAVAVALFMIIENRADEIASQQLARLTSSYVRGNIRNAVPNRFHSMSMDPDIEFVGNLYPSGNVYQFALFGALPGTPTVNMFLDDGSSDWKDFAIHKSCLRKIPGELRTVEWRMDSETITEGGEQVEVPAIFAPEEDAVIAVYGDISRTQPCKARVVGQAEEPSSWLRAGLFAVSQAFAAASFSSDKPPTDAELKQALADLTSRNTAVRRNARSTLSLAPVEFIPQILKTMKSTPASHSDNYQLVLGGNVALTLALRRNKSLASRIQDQLQDEDLKLIIDSAGHRDRTMRIYATEFLYDLGDPRVTKLALPMAADTRDETARYNWVFVSQGGWNRLKPVEKRRLEPALRKLRSGSGSQTAKLLGFFR